MTLQGIIPQAAGYVPGWTTEGDEPYVKSVKTPKRYPTKDRQGAVTDQIDLSLGAPAWAIVRADAMVGFTHENTGEIQAWMNRMPAPVNRTVTLRVFTNAGETNNFTSYDLLQKPALGGAWLAPEDFAKAVRTWYLTAYDRLSGKNGQIEYLQVSVASQKVVSK